MGHQVSKLSSSRRRRKASTKSNAPTDDSVALAKASEPCGRPAIMVDGEMRWLTPDGPGDRVAGGEFVFTQSSDGIFNLFEKEKFVSRQNNFFGKFGESSRIPGTGARSGSGRRENKDERFMPQVIEAMQRYGVTKLPTTEPIPFDITGRLDIDFLNPGPTISKMSQITLAPYLTINESEEQEKIRLKKDRKRGIRAVQTLLSEELKAELDAAAAEASDSSATDASADHVLASSKYSDCSKNCWLLRHVVQESIASAAPRSTGDSSRGGAPDICKPEGLYTNIERNETRILRVEKGAPGDPIQITVTHMAVVSKPGIATDASRETPPAYEALSYCWGDKPATKVVWCNGLKVPVTQNLHDALTNLRGQNEPRNIWVDAICINQDDVSERNQQVRHMTSIYRGARRVVVWLGDSEDDSDLAFQSMAYMSSETGRSLIFRKAHKKACIDHLRRIYLAQLSVFRRPWFRRTWIRQEIATARRVVVQCGQHSLSWGTLKQAAGRVGRLREKLNVQGCSDLPAPDFLHLEYLRRHWSVGQPLINPTGDIRSIWYYHAGGLLDLLMVGRAFEATNPRDKVYALLGIANIPIEEPEARLNSKKPAVIDTMRVDYSMTVSDSYQYLAKYIINRDGNLDILCILPTHRDENSADLPTWVPDWRVPTSKFPLDANWRFFRYKCGASGFSKAARQDQADLGRLLVHGYPLDRVAKTTSLTYEPFHLPENNGFEVREKVDGEDLNVVAYTEGGLEFCLVPQGTEPGDIIFLVLGCKMPLVLRLHDKKGQGTGSKGKFVLRDEVEWEVVGPSWTLQYMWGEAMIGVQDDNPLTLILV